MRLRPSLSYVIDPRFLGGTSTAVAAELRAVAGLACVKVHAVESRMFSGRTIAPVLAQALADLRIELDWDSDTISADLVVLCNPVFLKFQSTLQKRIIARHLIVVTNENFLLPDGSEAFDAGRCLDLIDGASLALRKSLAPVSAYNRGTVQRWLERHRPASGWAMLDRNWCSICDFPRSAPTDRPSDRRGRLSRPGPEKFPPLRDMDLCFPEHAEANVILGGDRFLHPDWRRPHWKIYPFRGIEVAQFFTMIDFMVYFTAQTWRESFGMVLAEAIAAGKVAISDPQTAETFAGAVVPARPADLDAIIARFIASPQLYRQQVERGQAWLAGYSAERFGAQLTDLLHAPSGVAA